MPSWFAGTEIGDDIWHCLVWRDDPVGDPMRVQKLLHVASGSAGVAWRVGGRTTDEFLKKVDQEFTIPVDPLEQSAVSRAPSARSIGSATLPDATRSRSRMQGD